MDEQNKTGSRSKISKWENNFMERHPVFHPIITEFIAELLIAAVLTLFAFNMLPPDLNISVSKTATSSSVLSITNEGFLYGTGEYLIRSKVPVKSEPVVISGKKYVDSLERKSGSSFNLQISGVPYKKEVKVEFKSGDIKVDEE